MPDEVRPDPDSPIDWSQIKPGPLHLLPEVTTIFNAQEWEGNVRRIAREVIDAEPFPETRAKCGCCFEVSCYDGERAQAIMDDHDCYYPPSGVALPDPWHKSFGRLLTNLAGWAAIAFLLYTLITGLLEP
jgi:hypothetical protein